MAIENSLLEALTRITEIAPLTDEESLARYGSDRTSAWPAAPCVIVLPRSTAEVVQIVRLANERRIAIVPSGGRTGLSGGAVAAHGEIVVSFERMNRILDFNPVDRTLRCEAGVILHDVQRFAAEHGLSYPVDYAASGSAQIGGSIATNAGGIKVIRHGMTRQWVLGLQVVTGTGEVLELNGSLVKNNTGYDLRQLFIGSEGTLGCITEAVLHLTDPPAANSVMLLALPRLDHVGEILERCRRALRLSAFEFFSDNGLRRVVERLGVSPPLASSAAFYLLVEFDAEDNAGEVAAAVFAASLDEGFIADGVLSHSVAQAAALWRLRESLSETMAAHSPLKFDVAVPVHAIAPCVRALEEGLRMRCPDLECVLWGHIGDGNLHINLLKPATISVAGFRARLSGVGEWIGELIRSHQGSISAEHGIGLEKKAYLKYTRSDQEIALMRGIKGVFDPNGIMNPGKIFDVG